jgi:hypothetical protein
MTGFMRLVACLALVLLTACAAGTPDSGQPSVSDMRAAAVRVDGPPRLTLITVINNRSGAGGHTALMISGDQRVIFDPAGSYRPDYVPAYGDVLYGISEPQFRYYRSAHARNTFHVVTQEIEVAPQVAAQALALAQARGTVAGAFCARSTADILRALPGFGDISPTFFPTALMEQFAARPGVVTEKYFENDEGDVIDGIPDIALRQ